MFKKIIRWIFKSELHEMEVATDRMEKATDNCIIQENRIKNLIGNFDVSVDVHQRSPNWAVISLQGKKTDYIKFIELGYQDLMEVERFLRQFERKSNIKIDAMPYATNFLKI